MIIKVKFDGIDDLMSGFFEEVSDVWEFARIMGITEEVNKAIGRKYKNGISFEDLEEILFNNPDELYDMIGYDTDEKRIAALQERMKMTNNKRILEDCKGYINYYKTGSFWCDDEE